ncbi:MAG: Hsp20/alpha crystallin family protein [Cytophagales bacterium]|nr:Hsp20/alpha crystallin family protein [Cytophagales bacterium]
MMSLLRTNRVFFDDFFTKEFEKTAKKFNPAINIQEEENNFTLELVVAGIDKELIKLSVEENQLIISAKLEDVEEKKYERKDYHVTSFEKKFLLPKNVNVEKITATQENGILHVSVPKEVKEKLKTEIKIS